MSNFTQHSISEARIQWIAPVFVSYLQKDASFKPEFDTQNQQLNEAS